MHFILHPSLPARLSGSLFWRMCYVIQSLLPAFFLIVASWCYKNKREKKSFKYNSYRPGTKLVKPGEARDIIVQNIGRVKLADHGVLKRTGLALSLPCTHCKHFSIALLPQEHVALSFQVKCCMQIVFTV